MLTIPSCVSFSSYLDSPRFLQYLDEMVSAPKQSLLTFLEKHFPVEKQYEKPNIPSEQNLRDTAMVCMYPCRESPRSYI